MAKNTKELEKIKEPKVLQNAFKEVQKDNEFVTEILRDVTGINLSEQEITKLKVMLRYETKGTLFDSITEIYRLVAGNFKSPEKVIVIPYIDGKQMEHINIQRIGY